MAGHCASHGGNVMAEMSYVHGFQTVYDVVQNPQMVVLSNKGQQRSHTCSCKRHGFYT